MVSIPYKTTPTISLISLSFLSVIVSVELHSHDHGHSHDEKPAFKYSKAANKKIVEDEILEEDIIDLPPQKGPDADGNVVVYLRCRCIFLFDGFQFDS